MTGGIELFLTTLLHLVTYYGTTVVAQVLVNNTYFSPALINWSESYRYRGVPNVTSYYVITSPGFPHYCCNASEKTLNVSLIEGKRGHFFLICTDVDVPAHSQLRIWSGSNYFMPETQWEGRRTRPIHWLPRGYVRIEFKPPNDTKTQDVYTGFRCLVWETSSQVGLDEWQPRPSDYCDRLDDKLLANGAIQVSIWPSELRIDFFFDCVWQLKVPYLPESHEEWYVYVHVEEMDVDGLVEVRDGLDSTAPLLATNHRDPPPNYHGLDSLKQPLQGFVSNRGLFVKLIKPYYRGKFVFKYGTYAYKRQKTSSLLSDYSWYDTALTCMLRINSSKTVEGFLCNSTQRCIPFDYACNDFPNCPDGSDEGDFCRAEFFSDGGCKPGLRQCQNRVCVIKSERCPEDSCPDDRPHKCDNDYTCFGPAEMCDDKKFCSDGADEDCSQHYNFSNIYPILGAICGACALLIIIVVIIWCWRRKRPRRDAEGVINAASDVPMMEMSGRRNSVEQEALINDSSPTPPNGYEDNVNQGADHESTTSLTHDT